MDNEALLKPLIGIIVTALLSIWRIDAVKQNAGDLFGKLPRALQWLPPLVVAVATTAGEGYLNGRTGEDLFTHAMGAGAEAGALAIAFWHVLKRFKAEGVAKVSGAGALLLVASLGAAGFGSAGCGRAAIDVQIDKALLAEQRITSQIDYIDSVFDTIILAPGITPEQRKDFMDRYAPAKAWLLECLEMKDAALIAAKEANAETIDLTKLSDAIADALQKLIGVLAYAGASPTLVQEQQARALTMTRGLR